MSYYWHNNNKCNKDDVLLRRQHIMSIQLAVLAHDDDSKNKQQKQQHDDVQQTVSFDCPQLLREWTTSLGDDVCFANIPSPPPIADNKPPLPHFSRGKNARASPGRPPLSQEKVRSPYQLPPATSAESSPRQSRAWRALQRAHHGQRSFFHWHWSLLPFGSSSSLHTEGSLQGRPARFQ